VGVALADVQAACHAGVAELRWVVHGSAVAFAT